MFCFVIETYQVLRFTHKIPSFMTKNVESRKRMEKREKNEEIEWYAYATLSSFQLISRYLPLGDSVRMPFNFANYYARIAKNCWKRFGLAIQKSQEWASSSFPDRSFGHVDGPETAGQFLNMAALIPLKSRIFLKMPASPRHIWWRYSAINLANYADLK